LSCEGGAIHPKREVVSQVCTIRKRATLAVLLPIAWLVVLISVSGTSSIGIASAQMVNPPETTAAQTDSLTAAFFLLRYDYELLTAKAEADSVTYEIRMSYLEYSHRRQVWTVMGTAAVMLVLFFATRRLD